MGARVWIIDDDEKLRELLTKYLVQFGFEPRAFGRPSKALEAFRDSGCDIVLLDVMLPEMDGFEVLKAIRERSRVPILMLTARGETADRVLGLELGSDDYLPKPFDPRELVARIHAILRRGEPRSERQEVAVRGILVDPASFSARKDGAPLDLTSGEFLLLSALASRAGRILTRDQLQDALGGGSAGAFDRSVDIMVSRLRTKLGDDPRDPRYIRTVRGTGYMFLEDGP